MSTQLGAFFEGHFALLVDIGREIGEMDASLGFLARLNPHDWQRDIAANSLSKKPIER